jgi:carbohydrate-binding DOMON domain-containing protein
MKITSVTITILILFAGFSSYAGEKIFFNDPKGDDFGPGSYTYPTDPVYMPGSFDLLGMQVEDKGSTIEFTVNLGAKIEDPWDSKSWDGNGFSLQMIFIFIDTDHKKGSGFCKGLPGLNIGFVEDSCFEKVVIISPQPKSRLLSEINAKAKEFKNAIIIPKKTKPAGKSLSATIEKSALGSGSIKSYGYQAVVQSNEGYPDKNDLLTRKVNEMRGQHRFGGGSDFNCDPHVIDILVDSAEGTEAEKTKQKEILKFSCNSSNPDAGESVKLPMVYK